jgi:5-methylcytosine-specific restriction endonuclease McrA
MADFYESREWLELRYRVLKKADGSCKLCGCRASPGNPLQVDHIKPRSTHPHLALSEGNMQVLCKGCNLGKSNKDTSARKPRSNTSCFGKRSRWIGPSITKVDLA